MILVLSVCACALTMLSSGLLAWRKLRLVYTLGVVNGTLYTALNCLLALSSPEHIGVLFLAIPSLWGAVMCAIGLYRLRCVPTTRQPVPAERKEEPCS